MKAIRWVLAPALATLLCLGFPTSHAAVADPVEVSSPSQDSSTDSETSSEDTSSEDSGDSSDGETSDSGGSETDSDADNTTVQIDPDKTREDLETKYGDPADVALAPKLLLPSTGSSSKSASKLNGAGLLQFDVIQLQHQHGGGVLDRHVEPEMMALKSRSAQISAIPLDIKYARISFKTPAQEFFDGAWVGIGGMATSAVALGGVAFVRGRRR